MFKWLGSLFVSSSKKIELAQSMIADLSAILPSLRRAVETLAAIVADRKVEACETAQAYEVVNQIYVQIAVLVRKWKELL